MKTDGAIAEVLEAERVALEAIARCEAESAALVASARDEARRVAARAEQRLAAVRARLLEQVNARKALLEAEIARLRAAAGTRSVERARLEEAVRRLAAELVSGGEG